MSKIRFLIFLVSLIVAIFTFREIKYLIIKMDAVDMPSSLTKAEEKKNEDSLVSEAASKLKKEKDMTVFYQQAVDGNFDHTKAEKIKLVLGYPNRVIVQDDYEKWEYSPGLQLIRGKVGAIIGISLYVNKNGDIIKCLGLYKDKPY